jgi:hypothetical protein
MTLTKSETALGWYWSDTKQEWQLARVPEADRGIHCYVIGASGSGKTKFLEYLIRQDIAAGQGCGVIDPHGDLIEDLKGYLALGGRAKGEAWLRERIVLVDLSDPHQTVAFNPIEQLPGVSAGEQAAELISSFRKIWSDSWGVRMEDLLRNTLIALSEAQRSLVDLPRFLTDAAFRAGVVGQLSHPIAQEYFKRFSQLSDRARLTWSEPVLNKVNALLANDRVRVLLAAPQSTFNLREVIDSGKILLVKLDKGRLKDAADLLGSLLLSKLQLAIFSRSDTPAPLRRPFYLYVDEFQNFAGDNFSVFLSEARKYGLSLVLAHQTLAQIPEELQSLILGNTGLQVVFRVNRRDAERMAKEFFAYSGYNVKHATIQRITTWSLGEEWEHYTEALQNQPPRCAHVKHKIQGGLIPIQTADVTPAWRELGRSPIDFGRELATLPIGANYLLSRTDAARVTAPRPQPMTTSLNGVHEDVQDEPLAAVGHELSEDERTFLDLVVASPQHSVSQLYTSYGASVWKGQKLREALIAGGYLVEIETRLGKRGRLAKYLIPSSKALEVFPAPLPNGRGGPLHRHLQRFVVAEASAKGYAATTEYALPNGGIVDVHVERGSDQVAVEIAMTSTATRELEHIAACLEAGYGEIVSLVVSETTRAALERDLPRSFDEVACRRVRVLPVKQVGSIW